MVNAIAPTIVQLNNGALSHFLERDYEKSIDWLRRAYAVFEAHSTFATAAANATAASCNTSAPPPSGGGISFMECDNDEAGSSSSSSSSASSPQQQQDSPSRPTSTTGTTSYSAIIGNFQMDSTLVKEKALRSSHVEPTCNYASSPGTAYFMYNRALVFSDQDKQDDYTLLVTYKHRTAAIILYNLALVHHTIGIQLGVSAALPHAVRLYEMALESIIAGTSASSAPDSPSTTSLFIIDVQKLLLALLNNLGNIYTHLYDSQNAQRCFHHLRVVLAASGPIVPGGAGVDEDYTFFFLNAVFQGKELCFAPAA